MKNKYWYRILHCKHSPLNDTTQFVELTLEEDKNISVNIMAVDGSSTDMNMISTNQHSSRDMISINQHSSTDQPINTRQPIWYQPMNHAHWSTN